MAIHSSSLDAATALARAGEFAAALAALDRVRVEPSARAAADVLRAELLERTGHHAQAAAILASLTRSRHFPKELLSAVDVVLARIDLENHDYEAAATRLHRAAAAAAESDDFRSLSWAWILLLLRFQRLSPGETSAPLVTKLRASVTKTGDPALWAALHVCVAQSDAQRGLLDSARRHTRIGSQLLAKRPHLWVQTQIETTEFAIAYLTADFSGALKHARSAVALSERSGGAASLRTTLCNLGMGLYAVGRFDDALAVLARGQTTMPLMGVDRSGPLDTVAKIYLAKGEHSECARMLDVISDDVKSKADREYYPNRHNVLTRSEYFQVTGQLKKALSEAERALTLGKDANDQLLADMAALRKVDLLQMSGRGAEAASLLDEISQRVADWPIELSAQCERIRASMLERAGDMHSAHSHFHRALRCYIGTGNIPGRIELTRSLPSVDPSAPSVVTENSIQHGPIELLHDVVALFLYVGRPELIAREIVHALGLSGAVWRAIAIRSNEDGGAEVLEKFEQGSNIVSDESEIVTGRHSNATFAVRFVPKDDLESKAVISSFRLLVSTVQELDRARAERENRLTLWPVDDEPPAEDGFVILGRMRELMTLARKVARARITVLITGESGTGKEVLARAVHTYSDRSNRPFVPFNCAAIPRDLVESHLFGHRRGAFTGADRDNPGILRAAAGGTIFLDEVGELSLDLQPKLLRFLESGEIAPLGEGLPTIVDVRVVAATNAKLETAVNDGRFREDLFYRLNVVRLDIPPLRERRDEIEMLVHHFVEAVAAEFGKGRVRLAEETMEHFLVHRWPGNVRQLQNEVRRIIALAESDAVVPPSALAPEILNRHLLAPSPATGEIAVPVRDKLMPTLWRIEREMIKAALGDHGGRVDAAAKALGISRKGLYLKRQRLGL